MKQRCLVDADWALANLNMSADAGVLSSGHRTRSQRHRMQNVLHLWGFLDKTVSGIHVARTTRRLSKDLSTVLRLDRVRPFAARRPRSTSSDPSDSRIYRIGPFRQGVFACPKSVPDNRGESEAIVRTKVRIFTKISKKSMYFALTST
ncbi:MAG: hypothetical protein MZU97_24325 [Bacillus subtilis]|nr:hypothetical protein [Bacillus subtilis]